MAEIDEIVSLIVSGQTEKAHERVQTLILEAPEDPDACLAAGLYLMQVVNLPQSEEFLRKSLAIRPGHFVTQLYLAMVLSYSRTMRGRAEGRDLFLHLFENHPAELRAHPTYDDMLRMGAELCDSFGPKPMSLKLYREVLVRNLGAKDYFTYSELCADMDMLGEGEKASIRAIQLDPLTYGLGPAEAKGDSIRRKIHPARYPSQDDFRADPQTILVEQLATEFKDHEKFIRRDTKFFTMGSCFARNIAAALEKSGYDVSCVGVGEHLNSSFANRALVDYLEGALTDPEQVARLEELLEGWPREKLKDVLANTDVFIITLGVAPAFFDRTTGRFVMPKATRLSYRSLAEKFVFRTSTVDENVENLRYIFAYFRSVSPNCRIVVTVSPIPLAVTFEMPSAVQADCLSKSVMRVAAHEIVRKSGLKHILYWPSFELFRWAGSQANPYFGVDDDAAWHVSESAVSTVVDCFVKTFAEPLEPA